MNKKELLEKINSNVYELEKAYNNLYHNKVYVVVDECSIVTYYKTKRGAMGWIEKHKDDSYYDEYFMDLVYPNKNCDAYEVLVTELINPSNNKMFWYNQLYDLLGNVCQGYYWVLDNLVEEAKKWNVTEDILTYILDTIEYMKSNNSIIVLEEKEDIQAIEETTEEKNNDDVVISEEKNKPVEEKENNIQVEVRFNEEKNGIELYFSNKPDEEIRNILKSNGFRWARYNKCWYCKDTEEKRDLLRSLGWLNEENKTVEVNNETINNIEYEEIDINDIESYTIDKDISDRENNSVMFRSQYTDHTKILQDLLQRYQEKVLNLLQDENITPAMEYKIKSKLQDFKKKYTNAYKDYLTVKSNNPSWAVTGRSGLNINKYNKGQNRVNNKMFVLNDIENNFQKFLDKEKNKLTKIANNKYKEDLLNTDIDNVEFKKVKVNIKLGAVDNVFDDGEYRNTKEVQAYTIDNRHYIIKNWGSWHIYNDKGQDLWNSKTTDKLEVAKKQLVKWLKEIQNKNRIA